MLKTGVFLSSPLLFGGMIGERGQEYCKDLNKRAKDVISTVIVRPNGNTCALVPCRLPLHMFPTKGSPNVVLTSITVCSCDVAMNCCTCGVCLNGPNKTTSDDRLEVDIFFIGMMLHLSYH